MKRLVSDYFSRPIEEFWKNKEFAKEACRYVGACVATSSGTVISITAGSGLTGGTITTSGTISVDPTVYIPYTGATGDVGLGSNFISAAGVKFGTAFTTSLRGRSSSNLTLALAGVDWCDWGSPGSGAIMSIKSTGVIGWASAGATSSVSDVGLSRVSAGLLAVGTSTSGDFTGKLALGKILVGTPTDAGYGIDDRTSLGINTTGNITVGLSPFIATLTGQNGAGQAGLNGVNGVVIQNVLNVNASDVTASVKIAAPLLQTISVTFAALPVSPTTGMIATISDGTNVPVWNATATGGGSTPQLVWYNGTNWVIR